MDTATTKAVRAAPWNKGKLVGQKPPLKLKGTGAVQTRHRQQVARLRFDRAARPRCSPGQSCRGTGDRHAEKDRCASSHAGLVASSPPSASPDTL